MIWALATLSENQRRILELLNGVWPRGYPEALLLAKGFHIELLSSLVRDGLATVATETVRAGRRTLGICQRMDNRRRPEGDRRLTWCASGQQAIGNVPSIHSQCSPQ